MNKEKKPLYRKVNTRAKGLHHNTGQDAKYDRNTKEGIKRSMKKDVQRGLDYTPLYMFLLSKIGKNWNEVHSEAVSRLKGADTQAIFHIVKANSRYGYVHCGEASRYSVLFVDEDNLLQVLDPTLTNEKLFPTCDCCTHTFNGKVLINKFLINRNG